MIQYSYSDEVITYLKKSLKDKVSKEDLDKLIKDYLDEVDPIYINDNNEGLILYKEDEALISLALYDEYEVFEKLIDELVKIFKKKGYAKLNAKVPNELKEDYLKYGFKEKEDDLELLIADEWLNEVVMVTVDHPYGSHHPYRDTQYELNYGYVYIAENDVYINAYVYGYKEPIEEFTGNVIGVIYHKDDDEIRLIVASPLVVIDRDKIIQEIGFEEQYFDTYIHLNDTKMA